MQRKGSRLLWCGRLACTSAEIVVASRAFAVCNKHHPRAEFMRGSWLEFGKFGFPVDKKEAFRCYARSAEKGYARAEYRMGMQFENSNESQKAIARYERGARLGDSASNYVGDPTAPL